MGAFLRVSKKLDKLFAPPMLSQKYTSFQKEVIMAKLVNLTSHDIVMVRGDGNLEIIASEGIARCDVERKTIDNINGYDLNINVYGKVSGLPDPQEDTFYIVSALVAKQLPLRNDLIVPDDTVRDEKGRIISCRAFSKVV